MTAHAFATAFAALALVAPTARVVVYADAHIHAYVPAPLTPDARTSLVAAGWLFAPVPAQAYERFALVPLD